jgi:hypothetical protein
MAFTLRPSTKTAWLSQFLTTDQPLARRLAESVRFISDTELKAGLNQKLVELLSETDASTAVFVEREQKHPGGKTQRLYKQRSAPPKTAYGIATRPVVPKFDYDPKVGSEGIIAQFLSQFCKEHPKTLFHPTVKKCIERKVRRFVLVTDMVGSGDRTTDWLESAWRTATLRSWHSYRLLRFEIVAFTATQLGEQVVASHPSSPKVRCYLSCPTIDSEFQAKEAQQIRDLCLRYDPIGPNPQESLGYRGTASVIAFAHSVPNNVPRLLFESKNGWRPLFRERATRNRFEETDGQPELDARKLERLRQRRLAAALRRQVMRDNTRRMVLFLAASARAPRTAGALSRKTGFSIEEVTRMLYLSIRSGWTDARGRLTDGGHRELEHARKAGKVRQPPRLPGSDALYYPQSLRAP